MREALIKAVHLAMADDWHAAHQLAQQYQDPLANWVHAVLHKIEGDRWNSDYWYAKTAGMRYEQYADPAEELRAIASRLET